MWNNNYNLEFTMKNMLPGEEICNHCDGSGLEPEPNSKDGDWCELCHKCLGDGAVDWIQQITGEQE
jgi:DnaJ-class molecular chaperone